MLSSAEAVLLVYLGKSMIQELRLGKDLKPLVKEYGLKYHKHLDKNTYIREISSTVLKRQLPVVNKGDRSIKQYLERTCCGEGLNKFLLLFPVF